MRTVAHASRVPPRGVVSIELILLMPLFALLFYSLYLLGDIMLLQQKAEFAARFAAWKKGAVTQDAVRELFFSGIQRGQLEALSVHKAAGQDIRFPKVNGEDDAEQNRGKALSGPPRYLAHNADGIAGLESAVYRPEECQQAAYICFEGNRGGDNQQSHQSYFGTDLAPSKGGGGWAVEQRAAVVLNYKPMGYSWLSLKLGAGHFVVLGKEYHTEIPSGAGMGGADFHFRQAAVRKQDPAGIKEIAQKDKTSWEDSGLMKELHPQP
ncbi:MAG: pilus assembly protein [Planctomycetota bacterium]|nr:pilus assembly protein [Planctomycetota bacterium]